MGDHALRQPFQVIAPFENGNDPAGRGAACQGAQLPRYPAEILGVKRESSQRIEAVRVESGGKEEEFR